MGKGILYPNQITKRTEITISNDTFYYPATNIFDEIIEDELPTDFKNSNYLKEKIMEIREISKILKLKKSSF